MTRSSADHALDLVDFIDRSPTPFHAVQSAQNTLVAAGFDVLDRAASWPREPGRYLVVDGGTLIAWVTSPDHRPEAGFRIVGAHTDSPNLRLKPFPDTERVGVAQLGVEVYGGVLLNSWLDRDLGLAGRLAVRTDTGIEIILVHDNRALLRIPQLAIHLDPKVNDGGLVLDRQRHLAPIWGLAPDLPSLRRHLAALAGVDDTDIVSWDLMLHDTQPSDLLGPAKEFISAPRIDNLLSCHAAIDAFIGAADCEPQQVPVIALFDHEEVGSVSSTGAGSSLLSGVLERIVDRLGGDPEAWSRALSLSLVVSTDGAHATHPNYPDRHEPNHQVALNGGPVLKRNANMRYATEAGTAALVHEAAAEADVSLQVFVTRSDLACGSTIGPTTAAALGVPTVDLGVAQLAMHSARELVGADDPARLSAILGVLLSSR